MLAAKVRKETNGAFPGFSSPCDHALTGSNSAAPMVRPADYLAALAALPQIFVFSGMVFNPSVRAETPVADRAVNRWLKFVFITEHKMG